MKQRNTITTLKKLQTGMQMLPAFLVLGFGLLCSLAVPAIANIDNTATVSGTYLTPGDVVSDPSSVSLPVRPSSANLVVTKTANDTTDVVVGQTITYTYTVQNSGNVTLTAVSLGDSHNGSGPNPVPLGGAITTDTAPLNDSTDGNAADSVWDTLAPGDVVTFTSTYVVTQDDIDNRQ